MKILTKQDKYLLFSRKMFSSRNNWSWKLLSLCLHFYNHRLLMLVILDVSWDSSGSHHHKGTLCTVLPSPAIPGAIPHNPFHNLPSSVLSRDELVCQSRRQLLMSLIALIKPSSKYQPMLLFLCVSG